MAKKYPKLGIVLKKLLFEKDMKPVDLARAVDIPAPTIHRLVTGKSTRPYKSSLKPIADYFSIDVDQLLGEQPLTPAKKVESPSPTTTDYQVSELPLIPWENLHQTQTTTNYHRIPFLGPVSESSFATIMPDTSMEPFIQRNSILIFDPGLKATDRSYVLVKLHETDAYILRQLLIDADHQYLKPLNPDLSVFKMRLLHKQDELVACLVEARQNFRRDIPEIPQELKS